MIRIRRKAGKGSDADLLTGVIERLGSGEKSEFAGPEELVKLVHAWSLPAEPAFEANDDGSGTNGCLPDRGQFVLG